MTELPRDEGQTPLRDTGVQARADAPELARTNANAVAWRLGPPEIESSPKLNLPPRRKDSFRAKCWWDGRWSRSVSYFGVRIASPP